MQIDPAANSAADNYKILTNVVVPRPIAWITSVSAAGIVNLAPYSFFNAVGSEPLYIVVSVGARDSGEPKDTAKNIESGGDFVVNMVTEDLLQSMNVSAADFPPDHSEMIPAHLNAAAGVKVKSPRLAEAQVSLECTLFKSVPLGYNTLFIGEVVMFHIVDALVGSRFHIKDFAPIGRLGSPSIYCRTTDRFNLARMSYAEWLKKSTGVT